MRPALDPMSACGWLALPPEDLLRSCRQDRYQGSGPGGQKRNRVYSGVRLIHEESGLSIEADALRESRRNLEEALRRLRLEMALSIKLQAGTARSEERSEEVMENENEKEKEMETEIRISRTAVFQTPAFRADASPKHADFPAFVLRAVYFLERNRGQVSAAAKALGCTASALTRFLKADKALWARAREIREAHGLHPLK